MSAALIAKYGQANFNDVELQFGEGYENPYTLFKALHKLHEYWYKYNTLQTKKSNLAIRHAEEYKANFLVLSKAIINSIIENYSHWVDDHTKDGWYFRYIEMYSYDNTGLTDHANFLPIEAVFLNKYEEIIGEKIDDDDRMWWEGASEAHKKQIITDPEVKDELWNAWLQLWPGYEETLLNVQETIKKLYPLTNSNDVNNIMLEISLALNVAHNSGLMYEHLGLGKSHLEALSNIDTSKWDEQMSRYSHLRVIL